MSYAHSLISTLFSSYSLRILSVEDNRTVVGRSYFFNFNQRTFESFHHESWLRLFNFLTKLLVGHRVADQLRHEITHHQRLTIIYLTSMT